MFLELIHHVRQALAQQGMHLNISRIDFPQLQLQRDKNTQHSKATDGAEEKRFVLASAAGDDFP